jgi:hypothetical protein
MIQIVTGAEVLKLVDRMANRPDRFVERVICVPDIGLELLPRVCRLVGDAVEGRGAFRLITSPAGERSVAFASQTRSARWQRTVIVQQRLHAKIYLAIGRRLDDTEAIVTSANLTRGGVADNIELGIRITGDCKEGRRVLADVQYFVRRLAA